jgi:hypothetical protein
MAVEAPRRVLVALLAACAVVGPAAAADPLAFSSTSCESAGGMRARLTIDPRGRGRHHMVLELASPGGELSPSQKPVTDRVDRPGR